MQQPNYQNKNEVDESRAPTPITKQSKFAPNPK